MLRDVRFWIGLALRAAMLIAIAPAIQTSWFVPFLTAVPELGPLPWGAFIARGGDPMAFPYGWPNIVAFLPTTWVGHAIAGAAGGRVGLGVAILGWELLLLGTLSAIAGARLRERVLLLYWLSPIALYVGYWHGQLDVFPTAMVVTAMFALWIGRPVRAGALFGVAAAAKLSMILPAPFVALYFLGRARMRPHALKPILAGVIAFAILFLPFSFARGFRRMVLETPESGKTFSFALPMGANLHIYILPVACLALLYVAWRRRKLDFEALWTFSGIMFLAFLLLTPASPGWVMWMLPFLVLHLIRAGTSGLVLYSAFSAGFVGLHLLISQGPVVIGQYDLSAPLGQGLDGAARLSSILYTIVLTSGAALGIQMYRRGIIETPFRAAARRPIAIGISGDSGAGKDTLVTSISGMFSPGDVAHVSGDDYHAWDRHKPMWRALTHLNPKANDLDGFAKSVRELCAGRPVSAPRYDHVSGRMGKPVRIKPGEIVIASGLHALWSPSLNGLFDVRIFLDMDETLRRFLKVRRDVKSRGHVEEHALESIERRALDGDRFIRPQAAAADTVMRLEPRHPSQLDTHADHAAVALRLVVRARTGERFEHLARLLTSLCGIQAFERLLDTGEVEILIEGEPTSADIASAARRLAPDLREWLDVHPRWEPGLSGVMQLVVLDQIERACRLRRVSA